MKTYSSHYINGSWIKATSTDVFPVRDSSTEEVFATVPVGTRHEAVQAIVAAREAWSSWSTLSVEDRANYLDKISVGLEARAEEIAVTIAREVGTPLRVSRAVQVAAPVWYWKNFAQIARSFKWEEKIGNSLVLREPIGVVGCITPWNFPLSQVTLKIAAALVAGCTVVLKPSEVAPISAMMLAEIIHAAGLPPGVFNLVNGTGPEVGEELSKSPQVDMISFTGSTRAGKRVSELASQSVKRVALELGGKSASVILADADFSAAVKGTIADCLLNSGQTCSAQTRMLVPENRYEEVKTLARAVAAKYAIGPALDSSTRLGPLVSAAQRDRVLEFIKLGIAEGAEVIAGGPDEFFENKGYFVPPTILRVQPHDTLAREEIFGPVLVVITYTNEEEAIKIANDTIYGLGGGVWGTDQVKATAVAKKIQAGQININGGSFNSNAPFGGYKQSGNGRENGRYGVEEFLEYKSLQFDLADF